MAVNGAATTTNTDLAQMAHLMRRAGFGASRAELEQLTAKGYEAAVDDLVQPERFPEVEQDIIDRYYGGEGYPIHASIWIYRMLNSQRPLQEKMALFWHHVFATGVTKNQHVMSSVGQIDTFRRVGMSNMRNILVALAKDPAMIFWLDNNENRNGEPNENWGRELLELFSMGVGNYTEQDIKDASRAFTGWTFAQPIPLYPHGYYPADFIYDADDHDDEEKTFLGETGNLNGEDIIDIIVKQPATARFISRHMYNFFVADEPQVPSWNTVPPQDQDAIDILVAAYLQSDGDIRAMLSALFNSDFFKAARFRKVKSPVELITGVIKLVGTFRKPAPGLLEYSNTARLMGQQLMDPPTVEGWHTGHEWIDGGTLNERVNFAVNEVGDMSKPGICELVERMQHQSASYTPQQFVDTALELAGHVEVSEDTRAGLLRYAEAAGGLDFGGGDGAVGGAAEGGGLGSAAEGGASGGAGAGRTGAGSAAEGGGSGGAVHVGRMLQLIVSTREYQMA